MISQGEITWSSGLIPMIGPEIVSEIISRIADVALVISSAGQVLDVLSNPNSKMSLESARWQGQPLKVHLTTESVPKFEEQLASFLNGGTKVVRPVELTHRSNDSDQEFPVRYSFHRIGTDGALLMLGQDLRPVSEMQQQLVAAQIALERDYEAQREFDTRLRVLMNVIDEGALFVSVSNGAISDCNAALTLLFNKTRAEILGMTLRDLFQTGQDSDVLNTLASGQADTETTLKSRDGRALNVRATLFRTAAEQMLLCLIRDANGVPAPSGSMNEHMMGLFERGADGIVFVKKDGTILSANDSFLRQTDVVNTQAVKGRSVTDFLGRGSVDLKVMRENAVRTGSMRLYATRVIGEHGGYIPVEIAATIVNASKESVLALVIRDASRAEMLRNTNTHPTDVDMTSVIELIGNQSLRGIVAKTTDVIEKICIETAVELTSNNRVAAAEMLGLSRQSLYVKLRKYDLLKRNPAD